MPSLQTTAPRSVVVRALPWALVATLVVALLAGLLAWAPWRPAPGRTPRTLLTSIGADASLETRIAIARRPFSDSLVTIARFTREQAVA